MKFEIDSRIENISVEIDGNEYPVAEKTPALIAKLDTVAKKHAGQHDAMALELDTLAVLLGKNAIKTLFKSGANENIDRVNRIYTGVLNAFNYNAEQQKREEMERQNALLREQMEHTKDALEYLRLAKILPDESVKEIHKPN